VAFGAYFGFGEGEAAVGGVLSAGVAGLGVAAGVERGVASDDSPPPDFFFEEGVALFFGVGVSSSASGLGELFFLRGVPSLFPFGVALSFSSLAAEDFFDLLRVDSATNGPAMKVILTAMART